MGHDICRCDGRHTLVHRVRRRGAAALGTAAVVVGTVVLAAPALPAAATGNVLGSPDPATGSPVTVAVIEDGPSGTAGPPAAVAQGAAMAAAYENAYGDGLDGHRIVLAPCADGGTPAGAQACATAAARHGDVAVAVPGDDADAVQSATAAGLPSIALEGDSLDELRTAGAFDLTGGLPVELAAVALQAEHRGDENVVVLVGGGPTAVEEVKVFGGLVFGDADVGFSAVAIGTSAGALEEQIEFAEAGKASAIGLVGSDGDCAAFLRAYAASGVHLPRYVLPSCEDPSIVGSPALDRDLRGAELATTVLPTAADRAGYAAMAQAYGHGGRAGLLSGPDGLDGLLPVVALATAMRGYHGTVSAAAVESQLRAARQVAVPFSGGIDLTCGGTPIAILLRSVCSESADIATIGAGSTLTQVTRYDTQVLF